MRLQEGSFQYVLPSSNYQYDQAIRDQAVALNHVQLQYIFAPFRSIEKTDHNKRNISHFLLHYDVEPDAKFTNFTMKIASDYVQSNIVHDMTEDQLCYGIQTLKNTFDYNRTIMPELYERVVYNMIPNEQYFPWKIYDDGEWKDHKWNLPNKQRIAKDSVEVTSVVPDSLYYPVDSKFPAVEFVFVKNEAGVGTKQAFGIQVTY